MASGPEHYREAERLADLAQRFTYSEFPDPVSGAAVAAEAQVHATLALAAATAAEAGKDTRTTGESTRPDDGGGQERETLLAWDRSVDLPEGGTAEAYVICRIPDGGRAVLTLDTSERQALASLLDAQLVDIHQPCETEGCGSTEDWDPADPALWGWTRLQVAAVDDTPRWWCSSVCVQEAMARAGDELAAQDRAAETGLGGDL